MRVIKFRAWKNGEMSNPFYFGQVASFPSGMVTSYFGDKIMQFTGLTDANGVEIYEGDIIRWGNSVIGAVSFANCEFIVGTGNNARAMCALRDGQAEEELEVVGNIHQNPGLLETNDV